MKLRTILAYCFLAFSTSALAVAPTPSTTLPNVAAMATQNLASKPSLTLQGWNTAGDGGGGDLTLLTGASVNLTGTATINSTTIAVTSGNPISQNWVVGMPISDSLGSIPSNTFVAAVKSTTVTMTKAATATHSGDTITVGCANNVTLFQDGASNCFRRAKPEGDFRQGGVTSGSSFDIVALPTTASDAGGRMANAMDIWNAMGIQKYDAHGVSFLWTSTHSFPEGTDFACGTGGGGPFGTGHYADRPGTLVLRHGAQISVTEDGVHFHECQIDAEMLHNPALGTGFTDGAATGHTFSSPPAVQSDFEYMRGDKILADDQAIFVNQAKGVKLDKLWMYGFDTCINATKADHFDLDGAWGDCNIGIYGENGGGQSKVNVISFEPFGVRQVDDASGNNVPNEELWSVTAIAAAGTTNSFGRHECSFTLGYVTNESGSANITWPGTDLHSSDLSANFSKPVTFPMWFANFSATSGALGCVGNGSNAIVVTASDATTATITIKGSEYGHGADIMTGTARWTAGDYHIGLVSGNLNGIQAGEVLNDTAAGANGIPVGSLVTSVCLSCRGPDPTDPYIAEIWIDHALTASQTSDTNITIDGGAPVIPGSRCNGHAVGLCAFINAAENVYAGQTLASDIASSQLPLSNGVPFAAGYLCNGVAGFVGVNTFAFGYHYNYVLQDCPNAAFSVLHADDNSELDGVDSISTYFSGSTKATVSMNGNGQSGRSEVSDLYSISDSATAYTATSASVPATGLVSSLLVASTTLLGSAGDIKTGSLCTGTLDGSSNLTCHAEEHIVYEVVDGTHVKILQRGQWFTLSAAWASGKYLTKATLSSNNAMSSFNNLAAPSEVAAAVDFEIGHGGFSENNVRVNGSRTGIFSHNSGPNLLNGVNASSSSLLYEDATAFNATHGCGNVFLTVQPWECNPTLTVTPPQTRLTLSATLPVLQSDITAATTVYLLPYVGQKVPLWDGNGFVNYDVGSTGQSLALDSTNTDTGYQQSGKMFDIFAHLNSGGTQVQVGTGPAWSSTTARGTGAGTTELIQVNGIWVNKYAMTYRYGAPTNSFLTCPAQQCTYLGSMYATANGQTGIALHPSAASGGANNIIGLWNAYNQVRVISRNMDSAAGYTYDTAAGRNLNNSASNRVSWVDGLGNTSAVGTLTDLLLGAADIPGIGIVCDYGGTGLPLVAASNAAVSAISETISTNCTPSLGLHFVQGVEFVSASTAASPTFGGSSREAIVFEGSY